MTVMISRLTSAPVRVADVAPQAAALLAAELGSYHDHKRTHPVLLALLELAGAADASPIAGKRGAAFWAAPLIWGMEHLWPDRVYCSRASFPAGARVFGLAQGDSARGLCSTILRIDVRVTPVAISRRLSAPISPQARTRGPAWIPLRGALYFR